MAILTLTSADAGKTIPVSGSLDWEIVGTDAAETIEVAAGTVATVKAGGGKDVIKLLGGAADYSVALEGSNAVFTHTVTGKKVFVPMTTAGDSVAFGNGAAVDLKIDAGAFKLGTQTLTTTSAAVTGATGTATGGSTGGSTAGQSFSLTSNTTPDVVSGTTGNDTITGGVGTFATSDVISDVSTTDNDTFNLVVNGSTGVAATVVNVEQVNLTGQYTATAYDFANTIGIKNLTASTGISGGTVTVSNVKASAVNTITLGSNVSTLALTSAAAGTAGTVTVDAGSASVLTLNGDAGTDSYTLLLDGDTLTLNGAGGSNIETLTLSSKVAANTVTLGNALNQTATIGKAVVTGDKNLTVKTAATDLTGKTLEKSAFTGTLTVETTAAIAADANFSKVAADVLNINTASNDANIVTVNEITTVKLSKDSEDILTVRKSDGTTVVDSLKVDIAATQTLLQTSAVDTLVLSANTSNVTITTLNSTANGTLANNAETIVLSGSKDVTVATLTATANSVFTAEGLTGKLTVSAVTNAATVIGGSGNDVITGSAHADVIRGGAGNDTISTGAGGDSAYGDAGNDSITGGAGADKLYGNDGDDYILGGGDADSIEGGAGSDVLLGEAGADTIKGGDGNDVITGGAGIDEVWGGSGSDTFVFNTVVDPANASNIKDFEFGSGGDKIRLNATTFTDYVAGAAVQVLDNTAATKLIADNLASTTAANVVILATDAQIKALNFTLATNVGGAKANMIAIATDTGKIVYDADGNFTAASVEIGSVQLTGISGLVGANFEIV